MAKRIRRIVERLATHRRAGVELRDVVLAIVRALGGRASRLRVQKTVFMVLSDLGMLDLAPFEAYRRGPWSENVSDVVDKLIDEGLLDAPGKGVVELTSRGAAEAEQATRRLAAANEKLAEAIKEYAAFTNKLTDDELLLYIYVVHGHDESSEEAPRVLARRRELALRMLEKGAVSISLAARLAGMTYKDFIDYAIKKGARIFYADESDLAGEP